MASRYLIASGTWDNSNTSIWAATSGGAPGASAPTSADDVFLDNNSGFSVTIASGAVCRNFTISGMAISYLSGSAGLSVYGSLNLGNNQNLSLLYTGTITLAATTTGQTIDVGNLNLNSAIIFNGVGGGWTLTGNINTSSTVTLTNGSLNTNAKQVTCTTFNLSNSNTRTLTLGTSTINCAAWTATTTTGLTFSGASSTINQSGNTFAGGGLTYGTVVLTGTVTVSGANTFTTLTLSSGATISFTISTTNTFTSAFNATGSLGSLVLIQSTSGGTAATLSSTSGTVNVRYCNIKDSTVSGGASFVANNSINTSGNTGWTFTGTAPSYNTSIVTAIARIQQGFAVPKFVMGGKGGAGATTYGLFKQSTTYGLTTWRSRPFVLPQPFQFNWLRLRLSTPVTTGVLISLSLRFDNGANIVYGNNISPINYSHGETMIYMTSDNFSGKTVGNKNVVLELDFQGSVLCAVELPITMMLETLDIQTSA